MRTFFHGLALAFALLLVAAPVLAEDMQIEPGKWQFETSMNHPMGGTRTHVETTCIEESGVDPSIFIRDAEECKMVDSQSTAMSMTWSMKCSMEGAEATAKGEMTSAGKTAKGTMKMEMEAGGMKMAFDQKWEGEYLGACD